jgi:uncharacterized protein (DUF58 family)
MPTTVAPPRRTPQPDLPPIPTAPRSSRAMPLPTTQLDAVAPLDLALLHDLPSLELRARFVMDGFLAGLHRSPRKGSSVEFAEYRDYQFGDDLRRIDWRLFGRTDRLHIKQTEHETQLRVFLVFDTSGSMRFSSKPGERLAKIDFARTVLAAMGLLALRQGDAFGLATIGTGLDDYLRPKASPAHWRTMLGKLDAMQSGGVTGLGQGLNQLAEILPARSLVVIASDFYSAGDNLTPVLRRLRFDCHEVLLMQVLDPVEVDFNEDWSGTFIDAENGSRLVLDAAAVRAGYLQRMNAFLTQLADTARAEGADHLLLRTDSNPCDALGLYLAERNRMI